MSMLSARYTTKAPRTSHSQGDVMGLGRRVVRKSVRRATPRSVRRAMHPARTVRYAVTPRPVKQVSRAAYTVRHPVGAAENKAISAVLYAGAGHRRRPARRQGGFWLWLTGQGRRKQPDPPAAPVTTRPDWPRDIPPSTRRALQPRPAYQTPAARLPMDTRPDRLPSAKPSPAGAWELEMRRNVGPGDGSKLAGSHRKGRHARLDQD